MGIMDMKQLTDVEIAEILHKGLNADFAGCSLRCQHLHKIAVDAGIIAEDEPLVFDEANFIGSDCRGADFVGCEFINSSFAYARLEQVEAYGVQFNKCDLKHTNFRRAKLDYCIMKHCNLRGALLSDIECNNATIENCDFTAADVVIEGNEIRISNCSFRGATFGGYISSAFITHCDLHGANCYNSSFGDVKFVCCNLSGADFCSCSPVEISFKSCDLRGADFSGSDFNQVDIGGYCNSSGIRYDDEQPPIPQETISNNVSNSVFELLDDDENLPF